MCLNLNPEVPCFLRSPGDTNPAADADRSGSKAITWEWDGVDIDESVKPKPNGDKVLSSFTLPCMVLLMLIVCVQKCKCKFCGDPFIGGPARIREHHTRDPASTHRYHLCTSKANAAIEFHAKCKAALDEKQAKQAKKEQHETTHMHASSSRLPRHSSRRRRRSMVMRPLNYRRSPSVHCHRSAVLVQPRF